ncbi:MAG: DUF3300 domain-containing protein [Woeseiaceae bacterium]
MSKESRSRKTRIAWLAALSVSLPGIGLAQVPVDESGDPIPVASAGSEDIPLLGPAELEKLVGPIALYPDDLLAIVLPATTYPLQLVQAERFLQELKNDSSLEPDESWDDSVIALLNYPEAIELLTDELDQTWRLGEAVVAQQADVVTAIENFRDRAYAAGNLKSDTHQTVSQDEGVIEITPVEEDVIYVPYYEPERVVVYQPSPVYYYYPRAYPVYYYPYSYGHSFSHGFFWGVTTAFTVGWFTDSLHVYHHSYYGHPYYGHNYGHNYWYRNPSIHVHNNYYYNSHNSYHSGNRYGHGDYWRPHSGSTVSHHDQRVTRSRHYPGQQSSRNDGGGGSNFDERRSNSLHGSSSRRLSSERDSPQQLGTASPDIKFRQRSSTTSNQASTSKPNRKSSSQQPSIKFRERKTSAPTQVASNRSAATNQTSRSSQQRRANPTVSTNRPSPASRPARVSKPTRTNQPSRSSSVPQANQPSRSSQPSRARQPSRSSQPSRASKPATASVNKSGSNQASSGSGGRRDRGSSRRR